MSAEDILISKAVTSLAQHYSQEIHLSTNDAHEEETTHKAINRQSCQEVPYFDPLLGKPTSLTAFTKHWVEELSHSTTSRNVQHISGLLIKSYESILREKCFMTSSSREKTLQVKQNAFLILIQFEQLLQNYIQHAKNVQERFMNDAEEMLRLQHETVSSSTVSSSSSSSVATTTVVVVVASSSCRVVE
jgi:hypothetical protein